MVITNDSDIAPAIRLAKKKNDSLKVSVITPPVVNNETFRNLTFIDNQTQSSTLELNMEVNQPTNNWAQQIEQNNLTDYYIPNQKDLVQMKSGVIVFNLPRYDQRDSVTCNYKFPQISHSYVIKNVISNVKDIDKEHYIVITPSDNIYVQCFTPTIPTSFLNALSLYR